MDGSARHTPRKIGVLLLVFLFLVLPGCKQPAPVELVDDEIRSPEVELVNVPNSALLGMADLDPARQFSPEFRRVLGHMLISGSMYDGPLVHREATLARAIFFDRSFPIVNGRGDTVAYRTIDIGTLRLDGYDLPQHEKHILLGRPPVDTLLGVQYSLLNTTGLGLNYVGGQEYRWQNPVTFLPVPLDLTVTPPLRLEVTAPTTATKFSRSRNLPTKWRGGGSVVMIEICDVVNPDRPVPLMHLRIARNRGEAVIPSTILRLLPWNRPGFLFTFSSDSASLQRINGYPDDVLVQGATSHSLYLQCTP